MTFRLLSLKADSELSSGISEGYPAKVLGADEHLLCFRREKPILLQLPIGPSETSTVSNIAQMSDRILVWITNSVGQGTPEVLLAYNTACQLLLKTMQENLFEISASLTDVESSLGSEAANIVKAACGTGYLWEVKYHDVIDKYIFEEIFHFLSKKAQGISPADVPNKISMLAKKSIPGLVSYSFHIVEDPELPNEERICMEIHSRGAIEDVSCKYDEFIESLVSTFPFQIRRWFVFDITSFSMDL